MSESFDLNDPRLLNEVVTEEFDPQGSQEFLPPPPPADGPHMVRFVLRDYADRPNPYVKKDEKGTRVVVALSGRYVNENGELGGFVRDWYLTSTVPEHQTTSSLAQFCRLAGAPLSRTGKDGKPITYGEMMEHVKGVMDKAGEDGVTVAVNTRWLRSSPIQDPETGEAMLDESGKRIYLQLQGQRAITARAQGELAMLREVEGIDPATLSLLEGRWHLYYDAVAGEVRAVQTEVRGMIG